MSQLTARDLMTPDVVTVPPETPVIAVARLLAERGISAVPVLDQAGMVVGVVTEADLIRRLAGEEDRPQGWLRSLFADPGEQAAGWAAALVLILFVLALNITAKLIARRHRRRTSGG